MIEAGTSEEKMISDLRPFSHYELAVTVFNSKGEGPLSEPLSFETKEGGKLAKGTRDGCQDQNGEELGGGDLIMKKGKKDGVIRETATSRQDIKAEETMTMSRE